MGLCQAVAGIGGMLNDQEGAGRWAAPVAAAALCAGLGAAVIVGAVTAHERGLAAEAAPAARETPYVEGTAGDDPVAEAALAMGPWTSAIELAQGRLQRAVAAADAAMAEDGEDAPEGARADLEAARVAGSADVGARDAGVLVLRAEGLEAAAAQLREAASMARSERAAQEAAEAEAAAKQAEARAQEEAAAAAVTAPVQSAPAQSAPVQEGT